LLGIVGNLLLKGKETEPKFDKHYYFQELMIRSVGNDNPIGHLIGKRMVITGGYVLNEPMYADGFHVMLLATENPPLIGVMGVSFDKHSDVHIGQRVKFIGTLAKVIQSDWDGRPINALHFINCELVK